MQVFGEYAQVEVVELVNDGSGLAFGIVGGRSSGVVVKSVLPGGVADRDGRLRPGDMLVRIGCVCAVGMCARQAAAVLRQCGARVRLLVARPHAQPLTTQSLGASAAPVVPSRLLAEPEQLERRLAAAGHSGFGDMCEEAPPPTIIEERHLMRPVASIVAVVPRGALTPPPPRPLLPAANAAPQPMRLPLDMAIRGLPTPETLSYDVELHKDSAGLGITVAGYVCEQEELSGIFVKSISTGSSADLCGKMQVNDRIVEVDGVSLHGVSNHRAVALLRDAKGPIVRLSALRYLRGAGFEKLQRALAAQEGRPMVAPPSPSVTSLTKYSFSVYEESTVIDTEVESEILQHPPSPTSQAEDEIVIGADDDEAERAEVRRIQDKWRDLLRHEEDWPGHDHGYDIVVGTVMKEHPGGLELSLEGTVRVVCGREVRELHYIRAVGTVMKEHPGGLGLSLEGTVRVVCGREVRARHYIRALAPHGAVARMGVHRVGDELLEVNGWRVLGAHHVEVVSRLRAVASPVRLVCARAKRDDAHRIYSRNMLGGSLQDLLSPPQRLIKAKSESSVVSLCSASTVITGHDHDEFCSESLERNKSRSLEPLSGLAMWSDQVDYIQLVKEDRGLGFSILDYLDPSEPGSSVIVVRSVVRGGAAAADGRLAPGDRLLTVNGVDVARASLHRAVHAVKSAPKGIVTIGVAKPLPCSTVLGGQRANGHSLSSQECINSIASDDQTGMDSFHECLQEYGEGLEVVQICLEPEDSSIKDEDVSALCDLSLDECQNNNIIINGNNEDNGETAPQTNGNVIKASKSEESIDQDDDMTITEDDVLVTPRELPDVRVKLNGKESRSLSKQQSKELSTSDEMVFAVTPTGLERISYEKYWKEYADSKLQKVKSEESWKECLLSPNNDRNSDNKLSVQGNTSLLYIDHEIDGYETCLDDDSLKQEKPEKTDHRKPDIKRDCKQTYVPNKDNDASAKTKTTFQIMANGDDEESSFGRPYLQEHIIKQMKSLRIEPLNVNISKKRKRSATKPKPSKTERKCVEYYNDQAECLEEYNRQKRIEEDERITKEEEDKLLHSNLLVMEKKRQLKKQEPSEESTDLEPGFVPVPGCHKCFLENYAYELTKAYADKNCKFCAVIRDVLEVETSMEYERRLSAPALFSVDSISETEEESNIAGLLVPARGGRCKSAGPLKFIHTTRKMSNAPHTMTVTARGSGSQRWGQPRRVTVTREPGAALGVSVVGGKVDIVTGRGTDEEPEKAIFGIFIKNVVANSPAGNCKELYTGDRILEVDGVCVRSASHERAVQLIKAAGDTVTLTVQSLVPWNTDSSDIEASPPSPTPSTRSVKKRAPAPPAGGTPQHEIKITVTADPDTEETEKESSHETTEKEKESAAEKSFSDSEESSDEEDERDLGGRVYSERGVEIDRASAGAIKRSREEKEADQEQEDDFGYTTNKIRKKYAGLGDSVVAVRLERSPKAGLGLSLAGHRDRSRMAVFVCGLNPAGSAAKAAPPVKLGDEILEVNGIVLHGRCHLNASAIIKGLAGPVFKIILLRRKQALEDVAVKPLVPSQFPVALDEESEDRFAGYKGVHNVSIKKGTSSLGIMIIEGRHAEVGQGIFISDIQDGSAAEQAGLQIGDMILAVNKDSLLGCSYDAAAATLKRTEGVVVLTVCNPNKKDDSPDDCAGSIGGASRPTSRNQTPDVGLKPGGASRPTTPKPPASPAKVEPPPDPAVAPILSNKDSVIEIATNNQTLGVLVLGGSDTLINGPAAVILEVYPNGAAAKDGRLQAGDMICECNGVPLTKDMTRERVCLTVKQTAAKMRMTIHRPDPVQYNEVEVEIARKPGKGIGLGLMARTPPPGVYISDLLSGGPADLDGRLQRGDIVVAVDGKDLTSADHETAAAAFKSVGGRAVVKVKRFKIVR